MLNSEEEKNQGNAKTFVINTIQNMAEGEETNEATISELKKALLMCPPALQINFQFTTAGMKALAEASKPHSLLTSLTLFNCHITDEKTATFAKTLKELHSLTSLDLSHNQINAPGATRLVRALPDNNAILNLSNNTIGKEEITDLATSLKQNTFLKILNLSGNQIDNEGATILADFFLQNNDTLTDLNLSGNEIGSQGRQKLANALPHSSLTTLKLFNKKIGAIDGEAFANALQDNITLTQLDLKMRSISPTIDEIIKTINKKIQRNLDIKKIKEDTESSFALLINTVLKEDDENACLMTEDLLNKAEEKISNYHLSAIRLLHELWIDFMIAAPHRYEINNALHLLNKNKLLYPKQQEQLKKITLIYFGELLEEQNSKKENSWYSYKELLLGLSLINNPDEDTQALIKRSFWAYFNPGAHNSSLALPDEESIIEALINHSDSPESLLSEAPQLDKAIYSLIHAVLTNSSKQDSQHKAIDLLLLLQNNSKEKDALLLDGLSLYFEYKPHGPFNFLDVYRFIQQNVSIEINEDSAKNKLIEYYQNIKQPLAKTPTFSIKNNSKNSFFQPLNNNSNNEQNLQPAPK
ncbi:hypothetical protein [Legionella fairfieldensis]|uniref:hypothetical protein n=1 Tax=Legionella fairfieldensis TaxID=45064 RepID=UPI00048FA531|nr:hypothetical protein [Legionella fairfieldensis]